MTTRPTNPRARLAAKAWGASKQAGKQGGGQAGREASRQGRGGKELSCWGPAGAIGRMQGCMEVQTQPKLADQGHRIVIGGLNQVSDRPVDGVPTRLLPSYSSSSGTIAGRTTGEAQARE